MEVEDIGKAMAGRNGKVDKGKSERGDAKGKGYLVDALSSQSRVSHRS